MATPNASTDLTMGHVEIVIRLGWRMAKAYHKPPVVRPYEKMKKEPQLPTHLPGVSKLSDYERAKTLIAEIQHDVKILEHAFAFDLKSKKEFAQFLDLRLDEEAKRKKLLVIHQKLHRALTVQDPRLAEGFDLGRMLSDTVLLSDPENPETLLYEFNHYRLGNAYRWLNDLHSLLPEHASYGVTGTLEKWEEWVHTNQGVVPTDTSSQARFHQALYDQGECWRQLLCGEKAAMAFLTADNYKNAGNQVAKHYVALLFGFISGWKYAIAFFAVGVAGIGYAIVKITPHGNSTTPAIIATMAGTLGISWKTVTSTLGQVVKKTEKPLWEAEVNEAIVDATKHLPNFKKRDPKSSKSLYVFPGTTSV